MYWRTSLHYRGITRYATQYLRRTLFHLCHNCFLRIYISSTPVSRTRENRVRKDPVFFIFVQPPHRRVNHLAHFRDEQAQDAVLQLGGEVFLMDAGQVDVQLVALAALLDVRVHHAPQGIRAVSGGVPIYCKNTLKSIRASRSVSISAASGASQIVSLPKRTGKQKIAAAFRTTPRLREIASAWRVRLVEYRNAV